jgi:hypothetical protein
MPVSDAPTTEQIEVRLDLHVDRSGGPDACHLWTGARNEHGYGVTRWGRGGRQLRAHRLAWRLANEAAVTAIRAAYGGGESQTSIGRRYGITQQAVSRITRAETWRRVDAEAATA